MFSSKGWFGMMHSNPYSFVFHQVFSQNSQLIAETSFNLFWWKKTNSNDYSSFSWNLLSLYLNTHIVHTMNLWDIFELIPSCQRFDTILVEWLELVFPLVHQISVWWKNWWRIRDALSAYVCVAIVIKLRFKFTFEFISINRKRRRKRRLKRRS